MSPIYHQKMIDITIIFVQWSIFVPTLSLAVVSGRTSRAQVERHQGFMALACVLGLVAAVLTLVHLSLIFSGVETADLLLSFLAPALTTLASGAVVYRGLDARTTQVYRR